MNISLPPDPADGMEIVLNFKKKVAISGKYMVEKWHFFQLFSFWLPDS